MTATAVKRDTSHDKFREAGYWLDKTVDQLLTEAVASAPNKVSIVADRADRGQAHRLTYKELDDLANRAATSLLRLGVGRGDVVTVQLPNWWEFVVIAFACSKIGAVVNPVMPILGSASSPTCWNSATPRSRRPEDLSAASITPRWRRACAPACRSSGKSSWSTAKGDTGFEQMLLGGADPDKLPSSPGPDDTRRPDVHLGHDG